jgi:hypothetical protein
MIVGTDHILYGTTVTNIQHYDANSITVARVAILWKVLRAKGCPLVDVDCG